MNTPSTIKDALTYWESGEGRPYMGNLINPRAYKENPENLGCMCAQGQVLVLSGKRTVEELLNGMDQKLADKEVAEVWNISIAHSILLRQINDSVSGAPSVVITAPKNVLGDKWSKVLDFWLMMDGLSEAQWAATRDAAWDAAGGAARDAAGGAARDAAWDAAGGAARDAAGVAAWDAAEGAARDAAWVADWDAGRAATRDAAWVAGRACNEIQGFDLLDKTPFLNAFGIKSLDDIPSRSDDYGLGYVPRGAK